jgi:hypothetical protein
MLRKGRVPPEVNEDMKISNAIASLLLLLPLLTLVPSCLSYAQIDLSGVTNFAPEEKSDIMAEF